MEKIETTAAALVETSPQPTGLTLFLEGTIDENKGLLVLATSDAGVTLLSLNSGIQYRFAVTKTGMFGLTGDVIKYLEVQYPSKGVFKSCYTFYEKDPNYSKIVGFLKLGNEEQ